MLLDAIFKPLPKTATQAQFLNNTVPFFTQYGRNVYASDIVQTCIDCIANEMSKLQPKHVRIDQQTGKLLSPARNDINNLLARMPNPIMVTRDLIEKTIWSLYLHSNAFVYPVYDVVVDSRGNYSRSYTAFWPLNPVQVEWMQDATGALFLHMTFLGGLSTTLPYTDLIHLRKKFSVNDVMGGGETGTVDNAALLKTLAINDTVLQGTANSVLISQGIKGILKLNTTIDGASKEAARQDFMTAVQNGAGVVPMDFKGDFTPIQLDTKCVDPETLKFLENKVLRWFGVSLPILNGDYTDTQYAAFYNKTLESIAIAMNQAFTSTIFTSTEIAHGNGIVFYQNALELADVKNKLAVVDSLGNRGAMSNNELRRLFGLTPIDGGDVYYVSLNYINTRIADEYQLSKAGLAAKPPDINNTGDGE